MNPRIADSSSIPREERRYYQPDDYYKYIPFGGTVFGNSVRVIDYDEQIKVHEPTECGLYAPEIIAIKYCDIHPGKRKRYPEWYWFEFGIRNVGDFQRSLEKRGYMQNTSNGSGLLWEITEKGDSVIADYPHVIWAHQHSKMFPRGMMGAWFSAEHFSKGNWREQVYDYMRNIANCNENGERRNMLLSMAEFAYQNNWLNEALLRANQVIDIDTKNGDFDDLPRKVPPGVLELKERILRRYKKLN